MLTKVVLMIILWFSVLFGVCALVARDEKIKDSFRLGQGAMLLAFGLLESKMMIIAMGLSLIILSIIDLRLELRKEDC